MKGAPFAFQDRFPVRDIYLLSVSHIETKGVSSGVKTEETAFKRIFLLRILEYERSVNFAGSPEGKLQMAFPWYSMNTSSAASLQALPSVEESLKKFNDLIKGNKDDEPVSE